MDFLSDERTYSEHLCMTRVPGRDIGHLAPLWSDFSHIPISSQVLLPGDGVLLCRDGVHDNLTDGEIEQCLWEYPEASAHRLVTAAHARSLEHHLRAKRDDISAVVLWKK